VEEITYIFIDGDNLRTAFRRTVQSIFGDSYDLDYWKIKNEYNARRAFFYDCVDDLKGDNETDEEFKTRLSRQVAAFDDIAAIEGFHVQVGHLSRSKKKRTQKEVDVSLAVDMMSYSYRGIITKAVLISGDRDFRPVVKAVVSAGTYVEVRYSRWNGSKELGLAADRVQPLDIVTLTGWAKLPEFEGQGQHFPTSTRTNLHSVDETRNLLPAGWSSIRHGTARISKQETRIWLLSSQTSHLFMIAARVSPKAVVHHTFADDGKLCAFAEEQYGQIQWSESQREGFETSGTPPWRPTHQTTTHTGSSESPSSPTT
jgi:uncharacterized LabA/DUF88 family protein